jgi:hypothetical protein
MSRKNDKNKTKRNEISKSRRAGIVFVESEQKKEEKRREYNRIEKRRREEDNENRQEYTNLSTHKTGHVFD